MSASQVSNPTRPPRFGRLLASLACTASLALTGMLPAAAVHAEDGKVYNGNACHAFGQNANAPYYYVFGILNPQGQPNTLFVECPGIRDEVYTNTGVNSAIVTVNKPANTTVTCYLFSYSRDSGSVVYATRSDATPTAGKKTLSFSGLGGYSAGFYGLQCALPPGATLYSYQLNEYEP